MITTTISPPDHTMAVSSYYFLHIYLETVIVMVSYFHLCVFTCYHFMSLTFTSSDIPSCGWHVLNTPLLSLRATEFWFLLLPTGNLWKCPFYQKPLPMFAFVMFQNLYKLDTNSSSCLIYIYLITSEVKHFSIFFCLSLLFGDILVQPFGQKQLKWCFPSTAL